MLRLEFDTCNAGSGWHEIDKVRVIGTTDAATGVAVVPVELVFQPWAHTFGPTQVCDPSLVRLCVVYFVLDVHG